MALHNTWKLWKFGNLEMWKFTNLFCPFWARFGHPPSSRGLEKMRTRCAHLFASTPARGRPKTRPNMAKNQSQKKQQKPKNFATKTQKYFCFGQKCVCFLVELVFAFGLKKIILAEKVFVFFNVFQTCFFS